MRYLALCVTNISNAKYIICDIEENISSDNMATLRECLCDGFTKNYNDPIQKDINEI